MLYTKKTSMKGDISDLPCFHDRSEILFCLPLFFKLMIESAEEVITMKNITHHIDEGDVFASFIHPENKNVH